MVRRSVVVGQGRSEKVTLSLYPLDRAIAMAVQERQQAQWQSGIAVGGCQVDADRDDAAQEQQERQRVAILPQDPQGRQDRQQPKIDQVSIGQVFGKLVPWNKSFHWCYQIVI